MREHGEGLGVELLRRERSERCTALELPWPSSSISSSSPRLFRFPLRLGWTAEAELRDRARVAPAQQLPVAVNAGEDDGSADAARPRVEGRRVCIVHVVRCPRVSRRCCWRRRGRRHDADDALYAVEEALVVLWGEEVDVDMSGKVVLLRGKQAEAVDISVELNGGLLLSGNGDNGGVARDATRSEVAPSDEACKRRLAEEEALQYAVELEELQLARGVAHDRLATVARFERQAPRRGFDATLRIKDESERGGIVESGGAGSSSREAPVEKDLYCFAGSVDVGRDGRVAVAQRGQRRDDVAALKQVLLLNRGEARESSVADTRTSAALSGISAAIILYSNWDTIN